MISTKKCWGFRLNSLIKGVRVVGLRMFGMLRFRDWDLYSCPKPILFTTSTKPWQDRLVWPKGGDDEEVPSLPVRFPLLLHVDSFLSMCLFCRVLAVANAGTIVVSLLLNCC